MGKELQDKLDSVTPELEKILGELLDEIEQ